MPRKSAIDMTEGPIFRNIMLFAIPLILNSIIDHLYSTADTVMMGHFAGSLSMAAVGAAARPVDLLIHMFTGLSLGVTVTCGNYKGSRQPKDLSECMHTSVILGLLLGFAVLFLGLFLSEPLLIAMDTPAEILADATLYMKIRLGSGPVWILSVFCGSIFHAYGDVRVPTLISIVSGFLNVCMNVLFVPILGLGVKGVALATAISVGLKAIAFCLILFSPKGQFQLVLSGLQLRWKYIKSILIVGIPNGLNNIIFSFSNVLLQASINRFGAMVVAGNTAAAEIVNYVGLIPNAARSVCVTATAQCCGARKPDRLRKIIHTASPSCVTLVLLLNILVTFFGKTLMTLISGDAAVADLGYARLMFNCWGFLLFTLVKIYSGGLAGIRKSSVALVCDLFGIILPRILWVWFVVPHMQSADLIYAIYPITWAISSLLGGFAFYWHLNRWKKTQVDVLTSPAP